MAQAAAAEDVAAKILQLRQDVSRAHRLRAEAEGNLSVAKTKLAEIDAGLRKLGLDPEKADVELAALERQLETTVTELQTAISAEIASYNQILTASKTAVASV